MIKKEIIESFNKKELQVYHYIETNKEKVGYMRIRELAKEANVSTATVLRFVKKMGFESYHELKYWCQKEDNTYQVESYQSKEIIHCLMKLETSYFQEQIEEAVEIIQSSNLVIFVGIGNSGGTAHYGARCFTNSGTFSLCQDDPFYNSACVKGTPVVIILSVSGETPEVIQQISGYQQKGCALICITSSAQGTLAKMSDLTLAYHLKLRVSEPVTDFSSQIPALYIIEMLAHELLHRNQKM